MELPDAYRLRNSLLQLSPDEFEMLVAEVWAERGWNSTVTRQSNDHGIDVIAAKSGLYEQKAAIQAKCYDPSNKVGRPDIQQYDSIRREDPEIDVVIVITTSGFTSGARQLASRLNVKTLDGEDFTSAILESLSNERILELVGEPREEVAAEGQDDQSSQKPHPDVELPYQEITREELTEIERDLANVYQTHWEARTDEYDGTPGSSLVFKFDNEPEELELYQFFAGLHSVEFTRTKRRSRAAKTARKYNWMPEEDKNHVPSLGETLSGDLTDSMGPTLLNVKPNGEIGESLNAAFEARFTTIVIEQFLDSSLENIAHISTLPFDDGSTSREFRIGEVRN